MSYNHESIYNNTIRLAQGNQPTTTKKKRTKREEIQNLVNFAGGDR